MISASLEHFSLVVMVSVVMGMFGVALVVNGTTVHSMLKLDMRLLLVVLIVVVTIVVMGCLIHGVVIVMVILVVVAVMGLLVHGAVIVMVNQLVVMDDLVVVNGLVVLDLVRHRHVVGQVLLPLVRLSLVPLGVLVLNRLESIVATLNGHVSVVLVLLGLDRCVRVSDWLHFSVSMLHGLVSNVLVVNSLNIGVLVVHGLLLFVNVVAGLFVVRVCVFVVMDDGVVVDNLVVVLNGIVMNKLIVVLVVNGNVGIVVSVDLVVLVVNGNVGIVVSVDLVVLVVNGNVGIVVSVNLVITVAMAVRAMSVMLLVVAVVELLLAEVIMDGSRMFSLVSGLMDGSLMDRGGVSGGSSMDGSHMDGCGLLGRCSVRVGVVTLSVMEALGVSGKEMTGNVVLHLTTKEDFGKTKTDGVTELVEVLVIPLSLSIHDLVMNILSVNDKIVLNVEDEVPGIGESLGHFAEFVKISADGGLALLKLVSDIVENVTEVLNSVKD